MGEVHKTWRDFLNISTKLILLSYNLLTYRCRAVYNPVRKSEGSTEHDEAERTHRKRAGTHFHPGAACTWPASGSGGGYCILRFGNDGEHFNSLGLAAALVLCGGLPTLIRSRIERPTPWLRCAIIGGLVVALGIYVVMRFT